MKKYIPLTLIPFLFFFVFSVSHAEITQTLVQGAKSQEVSFLQRILNTIGKTVTKIGQETTYFGAQTTAAVKSLQCEKGIVCVGSPGFGIVGPKTRAFLNSLASSISNTFSSNGSSNLASISGAGSGLVAYYTFDGNANDAAGSFNGSVSGGATYATGKVGQAVSLDGNDDYINTSSIAALNGASQATISLWFKKTAAGSYFALFNKDADASHDINMSWAGGTIYLELGNGTDSGGYVSVPDNTNWRHVVMIFDGGQSGNAGRLKLYVDGVQQSLAFFNTVPATTASNAASFQIGRLIDPAWYAQGSIDDVRVYNRALVASEVTELFTYTGSGTPPPDPTPTPTPNPGDTTPPVVSITAPTAGTVSGTITLSANAGDAGGIAGVQFKVDGGNTGSEDTSSPYSVSLNTTNLSNGSHTITATARDATGNQATSAGVVVTVSNAAPTPATSCPGATTLYVRQGASGNGSGCDWTNAYTNLPATLVRGSTYYVADGSYGSYTFNTPGSAVITIKKATITDHGPAAGWTGNDLGDGQAVFGGFALRSDGLTIDGQTRNENNWAQGSAYGIRITGGVSATTDAPGQGPDTQCESNITVRYAEVGGPDNGNVRTGNEPTGFYIAGYSETCTNWTMQRNYIHNTTLPFHMNGTDTGLIEYNWMSNSWSKEAIRGQIRFSNYIIRHNYFKNTCQATGLAGEGCTAEIAIWDGSNFDGNQIYGNIIQKTTGEVNSGGAIIVGGGNGWVGPSANNTQVYNNTVVGLNGWRSDVVVNPGGTGNVVRNNLFSDISTDARYWYVGANTVSNNIIVPTSAFVSYPNNLHLSGATAAGYASLSSPYNIDLEGKTRGVDGVWDLGAYEYNSALVPTPTPTPISCSTATVQYVRQGATGTGTGCDWTNAYTALPAILTRGSTYYVADGSYPAYTFDDAASGSQLITIKKATTADRGTASDGGSFLNDFNGQAIFASILFETSYYTFDGVTGAGFSTIPADTTPSNYGFYVSDGENPILAATRTYTTTQDPPSAHPVTNITIKHVYMLGAPGAVSKWAIMFNTFNRSVNNWTISHNLFDRWQVGIGAGGASPVSGLVTEYNVFTRGFSIDPGFHGEWINASSISIDGAVIRYNLFKNMEQGAMTGVIVGNNADFTNGKVYGNVFDGVAVGNGVITGTSAGALVNTLVYNNTFVNMLSGGGWIGGGKSPTGGNVGQNNLIYNANAGAAGVHTYNYYIDSVNTPTATEEPTRQTGTGNPFVNLSGGDYRLNLNSVAGTPLASPYNVDASGRTRTSWTRGAFEFTGAIVSGSIVYIRDNGIAPNATGSNCGGTWTNACDTLPAELTRGTTYYVAEGSYGSYHFDDAVSGTQLIMVKKATDADHGPGTGWTSSMGDGLATFGTLSFATDYIVVDGSKRNESIWNEASYGIKTSSILTNTAMFGRIANNVTLKYLDIGADYGNSDSDSYGEGLYFGGFAASAQNWLIQRSYIHNVSALAQHAGVHNITYEYNFFGPSWNKVGIRNQIRGSSVIIRYNIFKNTCQGHVSDPTAGYSCTAIVGWYGNAGSNGEDYSNSAVYGNVFIDTVGGVFYNGLLAMGDDRTSQGGGLQNCDNCKAFNNTFVGMGRTNASSQIGISFQGTKTGTEARNNIYYNMGTHTTPYCSAAVCSNNVTVTSAAFQNNGANDDYHLAQATVAGAPLASPYDRDMEGIARGSVGVWDIGAYEYTGAINPPQPTPTPTPIPDTTAPSVSITTPSNGSTITGSVSIVAIASDNVTVSSVQLKVDGNNLALLTVPPYSGIWNTLSLSNGSHALTAVATDAAGNTATSNTVTVTVNNTAPNNAPVLSSIGNRSVGEGATLTFTISANDTDGDALTYSASSLPTGATFNTTSRTLSFTPSFAQSGSYTPTFTVSDGRGGTDSEQVTITVTNTDRAPVANAGNDQSITLPSNASLSGFASSDPDGTAITYAWTKTGGPSTFTLTNSTTVSPTVTFNGAGTYTFRLTVSDGTFNATDDVIITVSNASVVITDTDNDGVPDTSDKCPNTPAGVSVNTLGCPLPRIATFTTKTNLAAVDLNAVSSFELGNSFGKVSWPVTTSNYTLVRSNTALDIDANLTIRDGEITLTSPNLPELNKPATLTFNNISIVNPQVLRDNDVCTLCSIVSFANNTFVISVPGFSTYMVVAPTPTPTPTPVTPPSGGGGGGGTSVPPPSGGGGGFSPTGSFTPTVPQPSVTPTPIPTPSTGTKPNRLGTTFRFTTIVRQYQTHSAVKSLQIFLNDQGFTLATTGPGSKGKETTYFGPATTRAIIKYQEYYRAQVLAPFNITKGTGYFGPSSIKQANVLLGR